MQGFFRRQLIAQGLDHRTQGVVSVVAVLKMVLKHEPLQPRIRLLDGMVESWDLGMVI